MTIPQAYRLLGLAPGASQEELKKRYRQLMHQVHPDAMPGSAAAFENSSGSSSEMAPEKLRLLRPQEINLAYGLLKKEINHCKPQSASVKPSASAWNAPLNPQAYRSREILHYAEDSEGEILGSFCITKGKYLWQMEEDFPLFLLSLYRLSKELLDEAEASCSGSRTRRDLQKLRQQIQPELTYLLAQQFLDCSAILKELAVKEGSVCEGESVYSMAAMLEAKSSRRPVLLKEGEFLLPSALRNHRLFVRNRQGQELGYLSFQDDRLYYIVVPLFEKKKVQVRIQVLRPGASGGYYHLRLWTKLLSQTKQEMPENLNVEIKALLGQYRKACWT